MSLTVKLGLTDRRRSVSGWRRTGRFALARRGAFRAGFLVPFFLAGMRALSPGTV
jgi:hypothetical protein